MVRSLTSLAKRLLHLTPFEIRRRLPQPSIDAVKLLLAFYSAGTRTRTVVQIGAADGSGYDPICQFLESKNLRTVLIEPIPELFAKLSEKYGTHPNVTLVQAAIADHDGEAKMYRAKAASQQVVSDLVPYLSSFDRKHIESFGIAVKDIAEESVPALSLPSLVAKCNLKEIDLLQIDAEGYDAEIVRMSLALTPPPLCINFERVNLSIRDMNAVFALLESRGYRLLHDAWNSLAIHERAENDLLSEVAR
jgi:FkbM family methyltransferase